MRIAILGWGSLIWDTDTEKGKEFARRCRGQWAIAQGLELPLEFSRVSESRSHALTLVIDEKHGTRCRVSYAMSKREALNDAICDLRSREGTTWKNIGCWTARRGTPRLDATQERIGAWAGKSGFDAVVWTALESNFAKQNKANATEFSVENAIRHIENLSREGKARAAEYVWRAPDEIMTALREQLQTGPWFQARIPKPG